MIDSNARIVVLISGSGSNLQTILDHANDGKIDGDVVGVISNRSEAFGLERAAESGVPTKVLDHTMFSSRDDYDESLAGLIDSFEPDVIVLAGFMRILTPEFVRRFSGKMINIHPSLLPKYTGLHTHRRAIEAGDDVHGCSVHFVTEELDGGPVILQAKVPIFEDDTEQLLQDRILEQEHRIFPLTVQWLASGRVKLVDGTAEMDGERLPQDGYAAD
ncbi:phosphoribosylglycinamide formyltransferase [Echinimonas agarilytica]|uniref:Phosphoribosylglycinamide formyltransferase n=1 Tax=Echinimonas agarilytica TaxID=1215918 RepID=A0AA41W5F1_9GAMM|nr:phosphoribosylglycinamide formyltransferase [Echinimonas agarilytica]MCM2679276.1 phosphoribosylglycinamide formyltransferase [Echinimonas agarilytica]